MSTNRGADNLHTSKVRASALTSFSISRSKFVGKKSKATNILSTRVSDEQKMIITDETTPR